MKNRKFEIATALSKIEWVGRKVTGSHNGTIAIKHGELILNDGKLIGGKVVVDTLSMKVLDITDPATNAQFAGHLASDDFFSSKKFPEATLEVVSVTNNYVEGNLTIKGISHPIGFDAVINVSEDVLTASAKLMIDRTKYEMKFRSGSFFSNLGDTLIYNDFELGISITAEAVEVVESALAKN